MKLKLKGKYLGEEYLPQAELPENAVRFREPEDTAELNKQAMKFLLPTLLLLAALVLTAWLIKGFFPIGGGFWPLFGGMAFSFLLIVPHELLHGVCFGRDAEVELYYSFKDMMAFVVCTEPVSKARFIWLSLCPNIFLGWLPLLLWALLPLPAAFSQALFGCAAMMVLMGCGDYMNVANSVRQMPKGSVQQLSGFHSYWYMP